MSVESVSHEDEATGAVPVPPRPPKVSLRKAPKASRREEGAQWRRAFSSSRSRHGSRTADFGVADRRRRRESLAALSARQAAVRCHRCAVILILLSPIMLLTLIVLTITTKGKPIFVQERIGY